MAILYGDGIHDDTAAIQEMIDSGVCEVKLPAPKSMYLISRPLELPSNFKLVLPRFAVIRLADNSNCFMLKNKTQFRFCWHVKAGASDNDFFCGDIPCTEYKGPAISENIEVEGGIWDFNNQGQLPNPQQHQSENDEYSGYCMFFFSVKHLRISSVTMRNPINFAITLDSVSYFTVENIDFDFNRGNPSLINMDGIHINGNSHFGVIRNLKGTCYDDLIALNADEGSCGNITNITIDGIYSENCHSAVRLLCRHTLVDKIHITNVYGTYYQYCIGITKYYSRVVQTGWFDTVTLDNLYVSKAKRPADYPWPDSYVYPLIYVEKGVRVKNLVIRTVHRREFTTPVETVLVGEGATVDNLLIEDISVESTGVGTVPLLVNEGTVKNAVVSYLRSADCDAIIDKSGNFPKN